MGDEVCLMNHLGARFGDGRSEADLAQDGQVEQVIADIGDTVWGEALAGEQLFKGRSFVDAPKGYVMHTELFRPALYDLAAAT